MLAIQPNKVGIEEFEDLFGSIRYYYVDKTRFIKEAMEDSFQFGLFTRPRRCYSSFNLS